MRMTAAAKSKAHTCEKHRSVLAACACPCAKGLSQIPVIYCDLVHVLKQYKA